MQTFEFEQTYAPDSVFPERSLFCSEGREIGFAAYKEGDAHVFVIAADAGVAYVRRPGRDAKLFKPRAGKRIRSGRDGVFRRARNKDRYTYHGWCYPALVVEANGETWWTLSYGFPNFLWEGFLEADEIDPQIKGKISLPMMQVLNRKQMGQGYVRRYLACAIKNPELRQMINPTIH